MVDCTRLAEDGTPCVPPGPTTGVYVNPSIGLFGAEINFDSIDTNCYAYLPNDLATNDARTEIIAISDGAISSLSQSGTRRLAEKQRRPRRLAEKHFHFIDLAFGSSPPPPPAKSIVQTSGVTTPITISIECLRAAP